MATITIPIIWLDSRGENARVRETEKKERRKEMFNIAATSPIEGFPQLV